MNSPELPPDGGNLPHRLRSVASSVAAQPDLAEVEAGAGRVRSRRRLATGVMAAMLVAGAGGVGFGIGRSVSDDGLAVTDRPAGVPAAAEATDDGDVPAPVDAAASEPTPDVAPAAEPGVVRSEGSAASVVAGDYAVGMPYGPWAPEPMDLAVERTLASGVRLRLQTGETWDQGWYEDGWTPADFCFQDRSGRVTVDGADVVDVAYVSLWSALYRGVQAQPGSLGWSDGHPIRFAIVQVDDAVSEVAVTWGDGLTDRVAVTDGMALLAVESPSQVDDSLSYEFELELVGADGSRTVTQADLGYYDDPEYRAACNPPPPALPDPGEQPADPAAAEQALRDRFALLWDDDVARDDKRSVLDDWTGVDEAADAVLSGGFADVAVTARHEIDEISFTSPTEAWFRYTLYTDVSDFYERYGTATLVDGDWQFARAVMCQDLSLGGGICLPGFETIYPPSWYERYGPYEEWCYDTEEGTVCEAGAAEEPFEEPAAEAPAEEPAEVAPDTVAP